MPIDTRQKDKIWNVVDENGRAVSWESVAVAVLMDIRDELKFANQVWGCHRFLGIPSTLDDIAIDARRRNRMARQKAARRRAKTLAAKRKAA